MSTATLFFPKDTINLQYHACIEYFTEKRIVFHSNIVDSTSDIELPNAYKSWNAISNRLREDNKERFEWLILPWHIFRIKDICRIHNKTEDNCIAVWIRTPHDLSHQKNTFLNVITVYGSYAYFDRTPGILNNTDIRTPYSIFWPNMSALYDYITTQIEQYNGN